MAATTEFAPTGSAGYKDLHLNTAQGVRAGSLALDIPVRDTASDRQLVQTVLRDVTERRRIEEELHAARLSAESSNEAKSRFLATVSQRNQNTAQRGDGDDHAVARHQADKRAACLYRSAG